MSTETASKVSPSREQQVAEALHRVCTQPTSTVADTALVTGQSITVIRAGIADGKIAVLRLGRNYRVLTGPLRRQLGID